MSDGLRPRKRQAIIHGSAEILFASYATLSRPDGRMSKKKLDLLHFSAGRMVQAGARPALRPHAA